MKQKFKKAIENINETKSWFFKKISKIDKPLAGLIKKKRERAQINKIRNEKGKVTADTTEIQGIIRDYYKQLFINKMDNLDEMEKFLERYNLPRLNQEDIKNMNRASLVAQWLRICLPMQGTRVRALVWEDPTCRGAAGPVSHNY